MDTQDTLAEFTTTELLEEVRRRLEHVPGVAAKLEQVASVLG